MKHKIFILLMIPILLLVTGCNNSTTKQTDNSNKIEIIDQAKQIKTTFSYDKKIDFSEISTYNNDSTSIEFDCVKLDIDFQMSYKELDTTLYEDTKTNRKNKKYYKEYTFGKYEAYIYGDYENSAIMNIHVRKQDNTSIILVVTMNRLDSDENVVIADVVDEKELQEFFNSIEVQRIEK